MLACEYVAVLILLKHDLNSVFLLSVYQQHMFSGLIRRVSVGPVVG